jgi:hypothetical protein
MNRFLYEFVPIGLSIGYSVGLFQSLFTYRRKRNDLINNYNDPELTNQLQRLKEDSISEIAFLPLLCAIGFPVLLPAMLLTNVSWVIINTHDFLFKIHKHSPANE